MLAFILGLLYLIVEVLKDSWMHKKGWQDTKWVDYTLQFAIAVIGEVWFMGWEWTYAIPAVCINGAMRLWFDPCFNAYNGNGFWHLGKNAWDQWIGEMNRWQQLAFRIGCSLAGLAIFFCWPEIKLLIK